MKNIIVLLLMCWYSENVFANIDERKIDIYFANGIKNKDKEAGETVKVIKLDRF